MNTHSDKTQENKSQSVSHGESQMQSHGESTFQFIDNRPEAVAQRKLQEMANNSPQVSQLRSFQDMTNNSPQAKQTAQPHSMVDNFSAQQQQPIQKKENKTGLPDNLKSGIENLSGHSMDDVKVHRNSDKPAQLQAHAYAQGTGIHLGPGQEKHLPHEAWHVVQQKQGRVKPTKQMKGKVNVNNDAELEKEADIMGERATQIKSENCSNLTNARTSNHVSQLRSFEAAFGETRITRPTDFNQEAAAGTLAGNGKSDLVVAKNLTTSRNMKQAINQASTRFAKIGIAANKIRNSPAYLAASGFKFVPFNNGDTSNGLEPFIFRVTVPYNKGKKTHYIRLDYQQDNSYSGYIVRQQDTGDDQISEISDKNVTNPTNKGHADSFNMAHADTGNQVLADHLDQDSSISRGTNEAWLDARAKLGGEGSRWRLVRNNSSKITDDSRIWTKRTGKIYSVSFRVLWLNWLNVFNKQYDISDSQVAKKLVEDDNWTVTPHCVKDNRFNVKRQDIQIFR